MSADRLLKQREYARKHRAGLSDAARSAAAAKKKAVPKKAKAAG